VAKLNEDEGRPHACMARATPDKANVLKQEAEQPTLLQAEHIQSLSAPGTEVCQHQVLKEQVHINVPPNLHTGEASLQVKSGCDKVSSLLSLHVCRHLPPVHAICTIPHQQLRSCQPRRQKVGSSTQTMRHGTHATLLRRAWEHDGTKHAGHRGREVARAAHG
jgi:hypothetical protein